jgi:hypothetical protein
MDRIIFNGALTSVLIDGLPESIRGTTYKKTLRSAAKLGAPRRGNPAVEAAVL